MPDRDSLLASLQKGFVFAAWLIVPLIFNPRAIEPFLLYKELALRALVSIAAAAFLWRSLGRVRWSSAAPLWAFLAFTFIGYRFAANPHEVAEEQLRLTYLVVYFILVSALAWTANDLAVLFWMTSAGGALTGMLGILEVLDIYPLYGLKQRILSLFGYQNLVAQYLMLALVCQIGLFLALERKWPRMLNGLFFVATATCLFLTFCRSAWLGAAAASALLLRPGFARREKFKMLAVFAVAALAVCSFFHARDYRASYRRVLEERAVREPATAREAPHAEESGEQVPLRPAALQSWLNTGFFGAFHRLDNRRFPLWLNTARIIADHPFLGCGAGNYFVLYPKYAPDAGKREFVKWAHNDYLHLLAEFGVLGCLLLGAWIWTITARGVSAWKAAEGDERFALGVMLAMTLAVGVDAVFSYDWYLTAPSLALWTAWGIFQSKGAQETATGARGSRLALACLLAVGLPALAFSADSIYRKAAAHDLFGHSHREWGAGRPAEAAALLERAVTLDPHDVRYVYVLGVLNWNLGRPEQALEKFQKAIALTPYTFAPNLFAALAHRALGNWQRATEKLQALRARDPGDPILAEEYWATLNAHGNLLTQEERYEEAVSAYQTILSENPDLGAVHYNLGNVYRTLGRLEEARAAYAQAARLSPEQDLPALKLKELGELAAPG